MNFQAKYKQLNKKQKEAVDTIEGPVMVIAGPGTGKTQILTLRIANILEKTDTPADGILALTFTEAGVRAMRGRLQELIGSTADKVGIYTFHGFAAQVINEYPEYFPSLSGARQLSEIESEAILREILKDKRFAKLRPIGEPDFYLPKIIRSLSEAKREAWTPEILRTFASSEIERIQNDEDSVSQRGSSKGKLKADAVSQIEKAEKTLLLADIYEQYEAEKKKSRGRDFDDLIFELVLALRDHELLRRLLQEKYLYFLIDEHQDTNDAQNLLVSFLVEFFDQPNLFVVGDEKQAIYRFQGASINNFLKFRERWPLMKVISLEENYRSHQDILDAGFSLIENNYEADENRDLRIRLKAKGKKKNRLLVVEAPDNLSAEGYLADRIRLLQKGEPSASIAVLVRRNSDVESVLVQLESRGFDVVAERNLDLFSQPLSLLFFSLIEALVCPTKTESLARTIIGGLWGLDLPTAIELIKRVRSGDFDFVSKQLKAFEILRREMTTLSPGEFIIRVGSDSQLTRLAARDPLSAEIWRSLTALSFEIIRQKKIADNFELAKELLSYRDAAEHKSLKFSSGPGESTIRVLTAHGAKGLEFDYVFLPYATEEVWLTRGSGVSFLLPQKRNKDDDLRDNRRLFYVALTRARKHAEIIYGLDDSLGGKQTRLRFIDEIDPKNLSFEQIKKVSALVPGLKMGVKNSKAKVISDYARKYLEEHGLSVTALNHFIKCPSEFLFKSILRLPEAPVAVAERGTAMHEAIAAVWRSDIFDPSKIEAVLSLEIKKYFDGSLLSVLDKEAILENLVQGLPAVAQTLSTLKQMGKNQRIFVEKKITANLKVMINRRPVSLPLHGKLDTVFLGDGGVSIYDYKTKQPVSLNVIKGLTKNSDGSLFRQLVFYHCLARQGFRVPEQKIKTALVFISPDSKDHCPIVTVEVSDGDLEKLTLEINKLLESIWSGEWLSVKCAERHCEYCTLKKSLFL